MARTPEFPAQARGEAGGRGLRFPKPPAHPTALAGCPRTLPPSRCTGSRGDTEAGSRRGSCILGGRGEDEVQGPCHCGAEHQHGLGEPWQSPSSALCPHAPLGTEPRGRTRRRQCTFLVTTAKANLRPGWRPPPRQLHGGRGGCRASAGRSGKPKLGLLKGTYRKTMRQIRCRLYKGINTKELDASLCFGAAQSKSWGQGPPAVPWHRDTNTAQSPQRRGQGQGTRHLPACHD